MPPSTPPALDEVLTDPLAEAVEAEIGVLTDEALRAEITTLGSLHETAHDREDRLFKLLRAWASRGLGSVDALVMEIAERTELSIGHIRNVLYGQRRSAYVLPAALAFYRERNPEDGGDEADRGEATVALREAA